MLQSQTNHMGVYQCTGDVMGQVTKEELHVSKASLPLSILMLRFAAIIILLERATNKHYHQDLDRHRQKTSTSQYKKF